MSYKPSYTEPLTADVLRSLLDYDPATGAMRWKPRARDRFASDHAFRVWNAAFAGKPAFTALCANGYRSGAVFGKTYRGHRIAMALHIGRMLEHGEFVDHINGDRGDNRACNMRLVSREQNMRNSKRPTHNTSGVVGVFRSSVSKNKPWCARIGRKHIGLFATFEEAVDARKEAEARHGYHKNHGRQ